MIDSGISCMDRRQPDLPVSDLLWPDSFIESCGEKGNVATEVEDEVIHLGEEHGCRNDVSRLQEMAAP